MKNNISRILFVASMMTFGFMACTKTTYVEGMLPVDSTATVTTHSDTDFSSAANDGTASPE